MTTPVKALLATFFVLVGFFVFLFFYWQTQPRDSSQDVPTHTQAETTPALDANERVGTVFGVGVFFLWGFGLIFYFIPALIALNRHHQNATAIALLNLLLGWTLLGWVISLVWSATAVQQRA